MLSHQQSSTEQGDNRTWLRSTHSTNYNDKNGTTWVGNCTRTPRWTPWTK